MTIQELATRLGKSVTTLKYAFPRTQQNLMKKGIYISKEGQGKKADYKIEYKEI